MHTYKIEIHHQDDRLKRIEIPLVTGQQMPSLAEIDEIIQAEYPGVSRDQVFIGIHKRRNSLSMYATIYEYLLLLGPKLSAITV